MQNETLTTVFGVSFFVLLFVVGMIVRFFLWRGVTSAIRKMVGPRNATARVAAAAPGKGLSIEEKLKRLQATGAFRIAPDAITRLLQEWSREDGVEMDYVIVLCTLAVNGEEQALYQISNLFYFDTECIEDEGSYAGIIQYLARITEGDLQVEKISDHVNGPGKASLSFTANGQQVKVKFTQKDDWYNDKVTQCLAALIHDAGAGKQFHYIETDGQDELIAYITSQDASKLQALGLRLSRHNTKLPQPYIAVSK
jgi:hypothetical protein